MPPRSLQVVGVVAVTRVGRGHHIPGWDVIRGCPGRAPAAAARAVVVHVVPHGELAAAAVTVAPNGAAGAVVLSRAPAPVTGAAALPAAKADGRWGERGRHWVKLWDEA